MLKSIIEFQKVGGHTVAYTTDNHTPSVEDRKLRLKLIFEELSELADAYGMLRTFDTICKDWVEKNEIHSGGEFGLSNVHPPEDTLEFNKIEALDANCDLSVVVNGAYCINGFTDIAQAAYDETMRSNMSKFCYSLDDALATVAGREDWTYRATQIDGKTIYVFLRKEDGKIMKGTGFSLPDYSGLFK